jgi:hypothetical protein
MSSIMQIKTPTYIFTASEAAQSVEVRGEQWTHMIVKNNSATPCFVTTGATEALAEAACVYPTAGTSPTPQTGKTILQGQTESYEKQLGDDWVAVVMGAGLTGEVHVSFGQNK